MSAPTRKRLARLRDGAQLSFFYDPADIFFLLDLLATAVDLLQPRHVPFATDAAAFAAYVKTRDAYLKAVSIEGKVLRRDLSAGAVERPKRKKKVPQ